MGDKYSLNRLRKICVSGTANTGKSTLIKDMQKRWPNLQSPTRSYRDVIKEKGLIVNQEGSEHSQETILNAMIDDAMKNYGAKKMVFDRCPLDNLIYSMWLNEKHPDKVSDKFIEKCIPLVRESLKFFDCIFFIPLTKVHKVEIVPDDLRSTDPVYIEEIDNLFKAVIHTKDLGVDKFFPAEDCPPIIEIFGDRETRIKMLELYINDDCDFIGTENSVITDLVKEAEGRKDMEALIKQTAPKRRK